MAKTTEPHPVQNVCSSAAAPPAMASSQLARPASAPALKKQRAPSLLPAQRTPPSLPTEQPPAPIYRKPEPQLNWLLAQRTESNRDARTRGKWVAPPETVTSEISYSWSRPSSGNVRKARAYFPTEWSAS